MKTSLLSLGMLVACVVNSVAGFSQFLVLPLNKKVERINEPSIIPFEVLLYASEGQPDEVTVLILSHYYDMRAYTRIDAKRRLEDKELNFREPIWDARMYGDAPPWNEEDGFPEHLAKANTVELIAGIGKPEFGLGLASFTVPKKDLPQTYLFVDFEELIFDGGFYYCVRLESYEIKRKKDAGQAIDAFMKQYRLKNVGEAKKKTLPSDQSPEEDEC